MEKLSSASGRGTGAEPGGPLPGGVDSLYFLAVGKGKTNLERSLLDYARALVRNGAQSKKTSQELAKGIHRYFAELDAVATLGSRTANGVAVELRAKASNKSLRACCACSV